MDNQNQDVKTAQSFVTLARSPLSKKKGLVSAQSICLHADIHLEARLFEVTMRISTRCLFRVIAALSVLAFSGSVDPAKSGRCLKDLREVKLDRDNVTRVRDYLCRSDRDDGPRNIRVQLQRVGDVAAGALFDNGLAPWQQQIWGDRYAVLDNAVLAEYRDLLQRFGAQVPTTGEGCYRAADIDVPPEGHRATASKGSSAGVRPFRVLTTDISFEFPLVDDVQHILSKETVPADLDFWYRADGRRNYIMIWRYLRREDLTDFETNLRRFDTLVGRPAESRPRSKPRGVRLLEHLTRNTWPSDFVYVSSQLGSECFAVTFAHLIVDIAVVENATQGVLSIENLLGSSQTSEGLRPTHRPSASAAQELWSGARTLQPGGKLIVPLRLTFNHDDNNSPARFSGAVEATAIYKKLMQQPGPYITGLVEIANSQTPTRALRKLKSGLQPPTPVKTENYAFGPEWNIGTLTVAGEPFLLDENAANFINLTGASGAGSR